MNLDVFENPAHTPVQLLQEMEGGRRLFLKREDLIHAQLSGNKWHKLKLNFKQVAEQGLPGVVTFGGAYSNHIYATAAAGHYCEVPTVGYIRGELPEPLNPTLQAARNWGMELIAVTRTDYRQKTDARFLKKVKQRFPNHWVIPEGGSNNFALEGCQAMVPKDRSYHYWCLSCGTGGTLAGIATALPAHSHVIGFPSLKGAGFLEQDLKQMWNNFTKPRCSWELQLDYHFGGYAKINQKLVDFMGEFYGKYQVKLDPIYTGKLLYGVFDLLKKGYFPKNSDILVLHSGGLQGLKGFEEKYGKKIF